MRISLAHRSASWDVKNSRVTHGVTPENATCCTDPNQCIGMPAVVHQLEMVESEGTAYTRDSLKEKAGGVIMPSSA